MWATKAPTRRTKRFYKELVTSFELLPKVDEPELYIICQSVIFFHDFSSSGWPDFWRPEREITTRRQSHRYRGRPKRGNDDFPSQSLSSLKYTFFYRPEICDEWNYMRLKRQKLRHVKRFSELCSPAIISFALFKKWHYIKEKTTFRKNTPQNYGSQILV